MSDSRAIARELDEAIDQLQQSLQQASEAAARIKALAPRVGAVTQVFDDLESILESGRQTAGAGADIPATATIARPTLVVPAVAPVRTPELWPANGIAPTGNGHGPIEDTPADSAPPEPAPLPQISVPGEGDQLSSFRLEFESRPGPLDLRAVDDAVSEHPSVRDVALLDYDGRRATLKVWVDDSASPADVQRSLTERTQEIFAEGNDVTIIALEDVA